MFTWELAPASECHLNVTNLSSIRINYLYYKYNRLRCPFCKNLIFYSFMKCEVSGSLAICYYAITILWSSFGLFRTSDDPLDKKQTETEHTKSGM